MARTRNWWAGQRVKESDLDGIFADMEGGDHQLAADQDLKGIITGLEVTENSPADLLVIVASGLAFDKTGRRIKVPTDRPVDLSIDENALSTNPATGNDRYISIRLRFARQASETQGPDLLDNFVAFVLDEFYELYTEVGVEALTGTAVPPDPHAVDITLADVLITHNQTEALNADISVANREYMVEMGTLGEALFIQGGNPTQALSDAIDKLNEIVSGAEPVQYAGGVRAWANADPVYTASPQSIAQCLIDLPAGLAASVGAGNQGAVRIGSYRINVGSVLVPTGTVWSQLSALADATNHSMPAAGNFSATTTAGWLTALTTTAGATTNGAYFIGAFAHGNFTGATVYAQLAEFDGTGAGDDGAKRVKTEAVGGLAGSTVRAQLNELDVGWGKLARASTWTAAQTIQLGASGTALRLSTENSQAIFDGLVTVKNGLTVSNVGTAPAFIVQSSVPSTFNGSVAISSTGSLSTDAAATSTLAGTTKITGRAVRKLSVAVTAANQTLGPTNGNTFILDNPGASTFTIDLRDTGPAPEAGDWMRFFLPVGSATGGYVFRNETSLVEVCGLSGSHASVTGVFPAFVEVEYSGSAWVFSNGSLGSVVLP